MADILKLVYEIGEDEKVLVNMIKSMDNTRILC